MLTNVDGIQFRYVVTLHTQTVFTMGSKCSEIKKFHYTITTNSRALTRCINASYQVKNILLIQCIYNTRSLMWTFEVQLIFLTESVVVYRDVPGHPYLEVHVVDVLGDQVNELLSKTLI